jgi:ABC-type uncharacterized transport system permease subunit
LSIFTQDDFWTVFLGMWAVAVSFVYQSVYLILPGKNPHSFYFCLGKFPLSLARNKAKVNWSIIILAIASLAIHVFVGIRTHAFKYIAR